MKTKIKLVSCSVVLLAASVINTFGSGKVIMETRTVESFSGIELKSVANVYITQGEKQEVRVEAEESLVQKITTTVKNSELIIDCKENIQSKEPINIYVTVKELCMLELSGSGNIQTKNEVQCDHMTLRLSGSGNMDVTLKSLLLKATLSGSGNLQLAGTAPESNLSISGSGDIDAQHLKTFYSTVSISGSGNTKIDANNELTVNITGSGNVLYVTEPSKMTTKISGSGEVQKI